MSNTEIVVVLLLFIVVILALWTAYLDMRLRRVLRGKTENIDESIKTLDKELTEIKTFRHEMETYLLTVEKRLKSSIQGVGTVRFNAFDTNSANGGNQSFASAFLDENKTGVVISCIHARGFVGVYAKPVEKGVSKLDLSDEEKQAISKSIEIINAAGKINAKTT